MNLNEADDGLVEDSYTQPPYEAGFNRLSLSSPSQTESDEESFSSQNDFFAEFSQWSFDKQQQFIQRLFDYVPSSHLGIVKAHLDQALSRDFVLLLMQHNLSHIVKAIFSHLDLETLNSCDKASVCWRDALEAANVWRDFLRRMLKEDDAWLYVCKRRGWMTNVVENSKDNSNIDFKALVLMIKEDIDVSEVSASGFYKDETKLYHQNNWSLHKYNLRQTECGNSDPLGCYSFHCDEKRLVSGNRDHTVKVWERETMKLQASLNGHFGSVLCVQFNDNIIISGSSDSTIKIWDMQTFELIRSISHHNEPVLRLRLEGNVVVVCSKDKTLSIWDLNGKDNFVLRGNLIGHRAAVNVVDFDERYTVSGSGDRLIKVWNTNDCGECLFDLVGHKRGVACLQYKFPLIVSGGSDNEIRLVLVKSRRR